MPDHPIHTDEFMERFKKQVEEFRKVQPVYAAFADVLSAALTRAVRDLGIMAIVQARVKEIPSFAEKIIRKHDKYPDAVSQLTDLCGARIIT
ncbi:hypothetical protein ACFL5Q_05970, partial [Planctomycetota bacterium]